MQRVAVAMSGGVDSSVAAALLVREGYEVIGFTLNLWPELSREEAEVREDACCSLGAVEDARRVADRLGIAHYTLNFRDLFAQKVIADFVAEYRRGRTPNPCIRCNEHIKFQTFLRRALALGADYIATGHYARGEYNSARERYLLRQALDLHKDQSYALYVLRQEQLAHTLLPLGHLTKGQTRQIARELELAVAEKAESQEICFVPDKDYGAFVSRQAPEAAVPGPILDPQGRRIGEHRGIIFYTVGQRHGLGIATGKPLYVTDIDPGRSALIVGEEKDLYASELIADQVNWIDSEGLAGPRRLRAKIRYRMPAEEAIISPLDGRVLVRFARPQRAITPGQAVVFYDGEMVAGGGTILRAVK